MQRLHVDDLAGILLQMGGWTLLNLPAIAEHDEEIAIGSDETFRRRIGDVLHPARELRDVLDEIKASMGAYAFSAQYQQRPVPPEGNLIKQAWLKSYEVAPAVMRSDIVVISWDTANTASELANYSVDTVWLVRNDNCYLLDLVRGQYDFPTLKRAVSALRDRWPGATILIEDKGSGTGLIQELRAAGIAVIPRIPEADKVTRLYMVQPLFEGGSVHFPAHAPWLSGLLEELLAFPHYRSDDQVDSISQALAWIQQRRRNRNAYVNIAMPISIPREPRHPW